MNGSSLTTEIFFIALASITDPALVAPTIVPTLGFLEGKRRSPFDHVCNRAHDKVMLLVLDNLEQVIAAAPMIAKLLAACPLLKILATSRIALRVRAERLFHVPALRQPDLARLPSPQELLQYPALALFAERAQAVQPDFVLTEADASTIARICHRVGTIGAHGGTVCRDHVADTNDAGAGVGRDARADCHQRRAEIRDESFA